MRTTLLVSALLLGGATAALSQDAAAPAAAPAAPPAPAPTQMTPPAQPAAPAPAQPATLSDNLRPTFVAQAPEDMVASRIIGTNVVNLANDTIGQITDFVLAPGGGIKSWVIGVGGFLGIGTKHVAIDPSALKLERSADKTLKATIDTNKDQLRAAPEYVYLGKEQAK